LHPLESAAFSRRTPFSDIYCPELVATKQSLELVTTPIGASGASLDEKHHRHPISGLSA